MQWKDLQLRMPNSRAIPALTVTLGERQDGRWAYSPDRRGVPRIDPASNDIATAPLEQLEWALRVPPAKYRRQQRQMENEAAHKESRNDG